MSPKKRKLELSGMKYEDNDPINLIHYPTRVAAEVDKKIEAHRNHINKLHGTKRNGIEVRYQEGEVDEIVVRVDGKVVVHVEQMNDVCFWMGLYAGNHSAYALIGSKNGQSHIVANVEAWKDEPKSRKG